MAKHRPRGHQHRQGSQMVLFNYRNMIRGYRTGEKPEAKLVPVAPFREAFENSGLSKTDMCGRLDWWVTTRSKRARVYADTSRLTRTLYDHKTIQLHTALALCEALRKLPTEMGL